MNCHRLRSLMHTALPTLLAASVSQCALAQTPTACQQAEHRQFDFWVGHWDVFSPDGRKAGENLIERIADGCALREHWRGAGGLNGQSLNSWDRRAKRWRQHWVDSSGGLLRLEGQLEGANMVLSGSLPDPARGDALAQQRITWTPQPDGAVRQHWERSDDGGQRWITVFDGRYVRRP